MATPVQSIEVRRAAPADGEAMHAAFCGPKVVADTLQVPYPSVEMGRKRRRADDEDDCFLVAFVPDRRVGTVRLHRSSNSPRRRHAAGTGLAVQDDWQVKGVGSALLEAVCRQLARLCAAGTDGIRRQRGGDCAA
jgi:L-phenylalanine/L-methionine N-acetyltransferase